MRPFRLSVKKVYSLAESKHQQLLYGLSGAVAFVSLLFTTFEYGFILGLVYGLICGLQIYYLLGYYLYTKQESQNVEQGKLRGAEKFQLDQDRIGNWPEIEKTLYDDPEKPVRERKRAEIISDTIWRRYKRKLFLLFFIPLLLIHLILASEGIVGMIWTGILIVSAVVLSNMYSNALTISRLINELREYHDKYKKINNGYVVQTQIQVERAIYPQEQYTTHGSASWLSEYEKNMFSGRFKFGLWLGNGFFHDGEGGLITIAATRSGKGAAVILPNLLVARDYPHSFVVLDPKGTNACISATFQKSRGQEVVILDPTGIQKAMGATHCVEPATFNILDVIDRNNIVADCTGIARLLIPQDPKAEKYWTEEAVDLFSSILMHIMTFPKYQGSRDLVTLYEFIRHSSWPQIFEEMAQNEACDYEIKVATAKFLELYKNSDKTFTSIVSVAQQGINWLKDPILKESIRSTSFDPSKISLGGLTLYLCVPLENSDSYFTWSRLMVYALMKVNRAPLSHERAECYYLLDEFPQLGRFTDIQSYLATSSEFKIRIWMFIQNLPQLDEVYGQSARESFIGNCRVIQAFGIKDLTTAKHVSEMLGNRTIFYKTVSTSEGSGYSSSGGLNGGSSNSRNSSYSINETLQARSLLTPDEVMASPDIINIADIGRFRLLKWQYWMHPDDFKGDKVDHYLATQFYNRISKNADKNPNYAPKDEVQA